MTSAVKRHDRPKPWVPFLFVPSQGLLEPSTTNSGVGASMRFYEALNVTGGTQKVGVTLVGLRRAQGIISESYNIATAGAATAAAVARFARRWPRHRGRPDLPVGRGDLERDRQRRDPAAPASPPGAGFTLLSAAHGDISGHDVARNRRERCSISAA
jgi:hypothetical protein